MPQTKPINPNRARDHLANERTYLAWMRTSLALLGFGAVIVRLRYLLPAELQGRSHGAQLGLAFGLVGLLVVPLATWEFLRVRRSIEEDSFEPSVGVILTFSALVLVLGAAVLWFLFQTPVALAPRR